MSNVFFLSIKKLVKKGIIRKAASHNLREMYRNTTASKSIDTSKSSSNNILKGASTAKDVDMHAIQLMKNAGISKIRSNAVRCIEVVFSLPQDTAIDLKDYFSLCIDWAGRYFAGQENILSAIVHRDQANPHCHLLILPLKNNRLRGSDMFGKRRDLFEMHKNFEKEVTSKYQLKTTSDQATVAKKRELATQVRGALRKRNDVVLSSPFWELMKIDIERNPAPYITALGKGYIYEAALEG